MNIGAIGTGRVEIKLIISQIMELADCQIELKDSSPQEVNGIYQIMPEQQIFQFESKIGLEKLKNSRKYS